MKYICVFISTFFILATTSFASIAPVSTQEVPQEEVKDIETSKTTEQNEAVSNTEVTLQKPASGNTVKAPSAIPNLTADQLKQATYTYYYGDGCSHCADMDVFLKKYDAYNTLKIEKKEVWHNKENRKAFLADAERLLGDKKDTVGTPFFVVKTEEKEIPLIGTDVVEKFIQPALGTKVSESYKQEKIEKKNNKMLTLVLLLIVALGIPGGLYLLGRKK